LRLNSIVGFASDAALAEPLHGLAHRGAIEYLLLDRDDALRHRLRTATDKGTECAISLARSERLGDGAVLLIEDERAIVVRMKEEDWFALQPAHAQTALELGYHAGNLHWRVRFEGEVWARLLAGDGIARRAGLTAAWVAARTHLTGGARALHQK